MHLFRKLSSLLSTIVVGGFVLEGTDQPLLLSDRMYRPLYLETVRL